MITLPNVIPKNPVDTLEVSESRGSDGKMITGDFLQLVQTARAGLILGFEDTTSRKVVMNNDNLKQVPELRTKQKAAEQKDTLAILLNTQGRNITAPKTSITINDKIHQDPNQEQHHDLEAITVLFSMLPHQELKVIQRPLQADNPASALKDLDLTNVVNSHTVSKYMAEKVEYTSTEISIIENSVQRVEPTEHATNLRITDIQIPLNSVTNNSPAIISTGIPIATSTVPILNFPLGSQEWQQQLSQQIILFTRQGQQHAELRLYPEHLGKVEISLKLDDNQLQLQIMSPHSHVRAVLEAAIPVLRSSLNESGMQLSESHVGDESSMSQQQAEQREHRSANHHDTFSLESSDDEAVSVVSGALLRLAQNNGAVDTFA